ncbi:MAG TPA: hypothetical protein P5572_16705, partial [Phycisphaerae bacterium]|nr:hypothetical protein [Phycisphaerae bacterium]
MLDIKFIRENADAVRQAARDKRFTCDVDRLLAVDADRRQLQQELDTLRTRSREGGERIGQLRNPKSGAYREALATGKSAEDIKADAAQTQQELNDLKQQIKPLEEREREVLAEFDQLMLTVPQPADADVPLG